MMVIKLDSRYKDVETLYKVIDENHGCITTNGNYTRYILSDDNNLLQGVDFEGGPLLQVGDTIPEINRKIKSFKVGIFVDLE